MSCFLDPDSSNLVEQGAGKPSDENNMFFFMYLFIYLCVYVLIYLFITLFVYLFIFP